MNLRTLTASYSWWVGPALEVRSARSKSNFGAYSWVNMRRLKIGMREQDDAKIHPASIVVSQLANALHRVLSDTDLEARLDALEQQLGRKP